MKKHFHRNSNLSPKTVFTVGVGALVLLVVFAASFSGSVASFVFAPVYTFNDWIAEGSGIIPQFVRSREELVTENQELREALAQQRATSRQEDRNAIFAAVSPVDEGIRAGVLLPPSYTPYDTLLIDKGRVDGIVPRARVYSTDRHVIGTVERTYSRTALVVLASAPKVESTAYLHGADIFVSTVGQGGGVLKAVVPQEVPVAVGDAVVLPGLDFGVYGTVSHIDAPESNPGKDIYISNGLSLVSQSEVWVSPQPIPEITFEEIQATLENMDPGRYSFEVPEELIRDATSTEPLQE